MFDFCFKFDTIGVHKNLITYMTNKVSKEEILFALVNDYFDDYEFVNKINDLTYHRKVALYKQTHNIQNNEQRKQ